MEFIADNFNKENIGDNIQKFYHDVIQFMENYTITYIEKDNRIKIQSKKDSHLWMTFISGDGDRLLKTMKEVWHE